MGKIKNKLAAKPRAAAIKLHRSKLNRLIREQGIAPVEDLTSLGNKWPGSDDAVELSRFLGSQRETWRNNPVGGDKHA